MKPHLFPLIALSIGWKLFEQVLPLRFTFKTDYWQSANIPLKSFLPVRSDFHLIIWGLLRLFALRVGVLHLFIHP
jgi:hypothetical protein